MRSGSLALSLWGRIAGLSLFVAASSLAAAEPPAQVAALAVPSETVRATATGRAAPADPQMSLGGSWGEAALPVRATVPDDAEAPGAGPEFGPLGLPCEASLDALRGPGATVHLRVEMPCRPWTEVTLRHGALSASYLSSSSGIVEAVFPAFEESARFEAVVPGQDPLSATVRVPGASGYERVATMAEGRWAVAVHAFEYGSGVGGAVHVWRGRPRAPSVADAGRGGYLLRLGDARLPDGARAEVYSFPTAEASRPGTVRIALGVEPDAELCGRLISAVTLQIGRDLPGEPVDLTVQMPACGTGTGTLMLKNLARDLKIAGQ